MAETGYLQARGLYRCTVMDTSNFLETGYIQIRIHGLDPLDIFQDAEIMTPFGGLEGMGIQALPPIGSIGFVLFELERDERPVFIGSKLVGGVPNEDNQAEEDAVLNRVESEDPSDFIIKTQYTQFEERELTGKENKVENILKMTENELTLAKVKQSDDNYEYPEEGYDMKESAYNIMQLTDEAITLRFKFGDNSSSNEIVVKEDDVSMSFDTEAGEMAIRVNENDIILQTTKSTVTINKDGNVVVEADKIELGGDSNSAVLYEPLRDFVNQIFNSHTHQSPAGPTDRPKPQANVKMKSKKVKLK